MIKRLHQAVAAVCPIDGLFGSQGNVVIQFKPEATAQQQTDAEAALASFDWSQAAHDAWLADRNPERKTIREQAARAIADNTAYLSLGTPSNAQVAAQVRRLTQQSNRIIPRLIQID